MLPFFSISFWAACLVAATRGDAQTARPLAASQLLESRTAESLAAKARASVVVVTHLGRDGRQEGVGSGFIVSSNGLVATSLHVIGEARPISVQLPDGKRYDVVEIHAWDRKLDLAVVRINASDLSALSLGNSDELKQGTPVVAMGNPLGLKHSFVQGVVSAKRDFDGVEMIQLAIPIEPGNSGGPMLDLEGRVQGILTLKYMMAANLGFAMPVNALKTLLEKPNPISIERWVVAVGALDPEQWAPFLGARWTQRIGRIEVEGHGRGFGGRSVCLWQGEMPKDDYEVSVTVRLKNESGAAGLIFSGRDEQVHYGFYPTGGQLRLTRFEGPDVFSWTILEQARSPHYQPGEWNALQVRCRDGRIRCYVNGHLVIESRDDKLSGRKVGLAKFRDTEAAFRNFSVAPVPATASEEAAQEQRLAATEKVIDALLKNPEADRLVDLDRDPDASKTVLTQRARDLERQAQQLRRLSEKVHRRSIEAQLLELFQKPEDEIDLFHAALLIDKLDNPELDLDAYRTYLNKMAREIKRRLPAEASDGIKLRHVTEYLFEENGFHGSRTDYYNPANSYISRVLEDREGIPITLSILFLELAQRVGLEGVAGVPLPQHFIVKHAGKDGTEQLIDPFNRGKAMTRAEAEEIVRTATGGPLTDEHLRPAAKREIVLRMLRNLRRIAEEEQDPDGVLRYLDLIVALAPDAAVERLNRAMLRARAGDPTGAKQDLKWLLDRQPPGLDLERISELYRSL